ncbi:MAG: Flp pilus assembly protein CpaB, partial [Abitibacteriaceae bacterium]|nr:Flp pilus assembly protein CpaB [Abditibacteriaceae bacterium]
MRPNRNIRVGVTLIVAAVLLFGLYSIFTRHNTRGPANGEDNSANNPNSITYTGTDNTVNTGVGGPAPGPPNAGGMIYTARDDIPERSIITTDMLVAKRWPRDTPTANYITDPATQAVGYITARMIPRGGNIMQTDLIGHITQVGVAGAIRPGFRAMVVPITTKATLHDLVHIGDYVDIIAAFDQNEARTIVQNVRVLAVDVFGKDFPQVKVAMRGNNKAEPNGVATGNEPSPP